MVWPSEPVQPLRPAEGSNGCCIFVGAMQARQLSQPNQLSLSGYGGGYRGRDKGDRDRKRESDMGGGGGSTRNQHESNRKRSRSGNSRDRDRGCFVACPCDVLPVWHCEVSIPDMRTSCVHVMCPGDVSGPCAMSMSCAQQHIHVVHPVTNSEAREEVKPVTEEGLGSGVGTGSGVGSGAGGAAGARTFCWMDK